MSENQNQPNQTEAEASFEELSFLKDSGEDISDLMPDLEAALQALKSNAPTEPTQVPTPTLQSKQDSSAYEDWQLPINAKGEEVKVEPRPAPAQQEAPAQTNQPVTQEQALDPYAPDAPKQKPEGQPEGEGDTAQEDGPEPGEVTLDAEGKMRDAKTGRYVPHAALHAERVRYKETKAEAERLREENARAQERLNMLTQIMEGQQQAATQAQSPQPEPEQDIDPEQDIFGAYAQLKKRHDGLTQTVNEIKNQTSQQSQEMRLNEHFRQDVVRFAQSQPDFTEAWRHLIESRKNELQEMGFTNAQAIDAQLATEQKMMVQKAYKDGKSPASVFYNMAKHRGWRAPEKPTASTASNGNGSAVPAAPAPTPTEVKQMVNGNGQHQPNPAPQVNAQGAAAIQNAQKSMASNASLSNAGGSPGGGLTIRQLAEMSDDDFVDLVARVGRKKFDAMLS